jgi:hypothetical protein
MSRRQLESVLCDYVRHYNRARPHRGLQVKSSRVVYDNHQHQLLFESLSK